MYIGWIFYDVKRRTPLLLCTTLQNAELQCGILQSTGEHTDF